MIHPISSQRRLNHNLLVSLNNFRIGLLEILKDIGPGKPDDFIFGGPKPLSNMALPTVLRRMGRAESTVHGFRSAARDWAGDETDHARDIAEMSLSHAIGDSSEQAYRRATALAKRRALLLDWEAFLATGATDAIKGTALPPSPADDEAAEAIAPRPPAALAPNSPLPTVEPPRTRKPSGRRVAVNAYQVSLLPDEAT